MYALHGLRVLHLNPAAPLFFAGLACPIDAPGDVVVGDGGEDASPDHRIRVDTACRVLGERGGHGAEVYTAPQTWQSPQKGGDVLVVGGHVRAGVVVPVRHRAFPPICSIICTNTGRTCS